MAKQVSNEDLAVMIKSGFDAAATDLTGMKSELKEDLGKVKIDIERLETGLQRVETKVDKALHVEYINLEVRVKRIEQKLDLKPIA